MESKIDVGELRKNQEEDRKRAAAGLEKSCEGINALLEAERTSFADGVEKRKAAVAQLVSVQRQQKAEFTQLETSLRSDIASVSTKVDENLVPRNLGLRDEIAHSAGIVNKSLTEECDHLNDEEKKMMNMIHSLHKVGRELDQEKGNLDEMEIEMQVGFAQLERSIASNYHNLCTALEGRRTTIAAKNQELELYIKSKFDGMVKTSAEKLQEVRMAIEELRDELANS